MRNNIIALDFLTKMDDYELRYSLGSIFAAADGGVNGKKKALSFLMYIYSTPLEQNGETTTHRTQRHIPHWKSSQEQITPSKSNPIQTTTNLLAS